MITITVKTMAALSDDNHQREVLCLGQVLCASDNPVFAAARILYNRGVDPNTVLMIHVNAKSARSTTIGAAAELTHRLYAKPEARPYKPFLDRLERASQHP